MQTKEVNKDQVGRTKLSSISPDRKVASNSQTGVTGVSKTKEKGRRYRAAITIEGKKIELGRFKTLKQATLARKAAEEKYYKPILDQYPVETVSYVDNGKIVDLTGKEYPHFKVVSFLGMANDRRRRWLCKCECGKTFIASSSNIRERKIISCGCIQKEEIPNKTKPVYQCNCILVDGTNLTKIANKKANRNNRSGTKGIYQDRCGTWYAKIVFRGVEHRIKCTSQLQAIYKRKELEIEYFDPVVKEHKKLLAKKKTKKGK